MRKDFQAVSEQLCQDYQNILNSLSKERLGKLGLSQKQIETMRDAYKQGVLDALIKVEGYFEEMGQG